MRCHFCEDKAVYMVEFWYCWSRCNPEVTWPVCEHCYRAGKDNPGWLGERRDRRVIVRRIKAA